MENTTSENKKIYKTPIYTRNAIAKYHEKHKNDKDYKEKRQEYQKKYYESKKEKNITTLDIFELIRNNKK